VSCIRRVIRVNKGIIHRDIKPENVFLKVERAVLGDFGFCKLLSSNTELTSGAFGSPMYMAPEVIQGKSYGLASDLYSLGILLYEMLMGNVPYNATNIDDLLKVILERGPQFTGRKLSKKLEALIISMLVANPTARISHATLFETVLKDQSYPNNLLEGDSQSHQSKRQPDVTSETSALDDFVKEILFERSKYTYLIDLAGKATYFKKYGIYDKA
jgi:serine/threonine protein kinase